MRVYVFCLVAFLMGSALTRGQERDSPRGRADVEDGVEVLTRGPVHEAFAETVIFDPEPGIVTPKAPPAAIEELPPEQRPAGTNIAWIPGYWAWDDERTDFLWVSGIWRALPPGRQWVPGYWRRVAAGAQWTSGYWADGSANEMEYLPEPPATVEAGPNVPASRADQIWLPGCWLWQQNRYAWRPGYWAKGHSDWDWVPAHYVWTPRGYVFVDGYYDYTAARRGVLFAPVYFNSRLHSQRGFSYSPSTVINPAVFASHLFLRPRYGHYYFGDYYGSNYSSSGFSPWFSFYSSRTGYDPFYAQQHWQHRDDGRWNRQLQANFAHRRDHRNARPPRTFAAQQQLRSNGRRGGQNMESVIAQQLEQVRKDKDRSIRFQTVDNEERQRFSRLGNAAWTHREQRQKLETNAVDPAVERPAQRFDPARVKLPRSPFVAQRPEAFSQGQRPPQMHPNPQLDPRFVPRSRPQEQSQADPRPETSKRRPRVGPKPATSVETRPKAQPMPASPKVSRRASPTVGQRKQTDKGNGNRPKGGSKGPSKGKDKSPS